MGLERGRVLQEEPIYCRLREVQLLQGKQRPMPVLRRGLERGRVLQEEPIYFRLREVQLLPGKPRQVQFLQGGLERGRVLQEEPPRVPPGCNREGCCKTFSAKCRACNRG